MTTEPVAESAESSTERVAAWLLTISEEDFRGIVADDVHRKLDGEAAAALRHPSVLVRWTRMLKVLLKDAHVQMQEKRLGPGNNSEWRVKVARWEERVMDRQAEARSLVRRFEARAQSATSLADKRARGDAREAALARLIQAHRDEFSRYLEEERALAGVLPKVRPGSADAPA